MEQKEEIKISVIDKERIILNPENTFGIFHIDEDAKNIQYGKHIYTKIEGLLFLERMNKNEDDEEVRIEIHNEGKRFIVISKRYFEDLKKVFEGIGRGDFEYFVFEKDNPIIIKSGNLAGAIAPIIEE